VRAARRAQPRGSGEAREDPGEPRSRGSGRPSDLPASGEPGEVVGHGEDEFFFFEFFEFLFLKKFIQNVYLESFMFVDKVFKKKFNKRFYRKTYLF
jgi:hypothetical protein